MKSPHPRLPPTIPFMQIRFVFDNSYSRLRSKQVKFEVKRGGTDRPPELGPLPPTQLTPPVSPAGKGKKSRSPTRTMPASAAASPSPSRPPARFPASRERQRKATSPETVEETKEADGDGARGKLTTASA